MSVVSLILYTNSHFISHSITLIVAFPLSSVIICGFFYTFAYRLSVMTTISDDLSYFLQYFVMTFFISVISFYILLWQFFS